MIKNYYNQKFKVELVLKRKKTKDDLKLVPNELIIDG